MSDTLTLSAQTRERAGKGASRAMRRDGRVPAVIYGNKQAPVSIHLEEKALVKAMSTGHFMNTVVMIEGAGRAAIRTLPKDVQFHPVSDRPLHVDFLRISEHAKVRVDVPVVFTDEAESPGLKRGGVLNVVVHDLGIEADAAEIPSQISVSLKGLEVGDSIHLSSLALPAGAVPTDEDDVTIATIVAPSALKAQGEEDAAEDAATAEAAAAESAETEAPEGDAEAGETPAEE